MQHIFDLFACVIHFIIVGLKWRYGHTFLWYDGCLHERVSGFSGFHKTFGISNDNYTYETIETVCIQNGVTYLETCIFMLRGFSLPLTIHPLSCIFKCFHRWQLLLRIIQKIKNISQRKKVVWREFHRDREIGS